MVYEITVISPCYNSEKTLERCINSIINQSIGFENIELILYDDASKDNTKKIIEEYSKKYENIIPIFSNINHGPGFGKDLAIEKSTGNYLMFIDSDDEYDKNMCETLLKEIDEEIDVVSCNFKIIYDDSNSEINYCMFDKSKDKILLIHDELIYLHSFIMVNKLFKKNIIMKNNVRFTSLRNGEDEVFLRHYLLYSKKFIHLNYVGYIIYKQQDSISNSQSVNDLCSLFLTCKKIKEIYEDSGADISNILKHRIKYFIQLLYMRDLLNNYDKNILYAALENLKCLENEISFDKKLGLMNDISNFFIMHGQFKLVVIYSKILFNIRKSDLLLRIYRSVTQ